MTYRFRVVAGSMEVLESFLRNQLPGVAVSHESTPSRKAESRPTRTMAYDSAEDILQFIVSASRDIEIGLFTAWLFERVNAPSRRRTTVNEKPVPETRAELEELIAELINQQTEGATSESSAKEKK